MKKIIKLISIALIAITLTLNLGACSKGNDIISPSEEEYMEIPLLISGEHIMVTDLPMSMRASKQQAYYAVKVQEFNNNTSSYDWYAAGTFDNEDKITIKLSKSKHYRFTVALLYDYLENYSFGKNNFVTNEFNYNNPYPAREVHGGYGTPFTTKGGMETSTALVDSYYGFLIDYSPESNNKCEIELKRVSSALEIVVEGLTEGYISCTMPVDFNIEPSKPTQNITFTHKSMLDLYGMEIKDKARLTIKLDYVNKEGNKTVLVYESMDFFRGYRKRILINLNNSSKEEAERSISISKENISIVDEKEQVVFNCEI